MNLDLLLLGAGVYAAQQYIQGKAPAISEPKQGQTISYASFPAVLTVKGSSSRPLTLSLFTVAGPISSEQVSGNFTASLFVEGPGPHELKWSYKDSANNTITSTISLSIKDTSVTSPLEWGQLHGVNWVSSVMKWKENLAQPPTNSINPQDINKFMTICANANWNLIRLVVYQECYEAHRPAFFTEMKAIIEAADQRGIAVVIDNHQWEIGGGMYAASLGVPKKYRQGYTAPVGPYEQAPAGSDTVKWWQDFYANNLRQFPNCHADLANYFDDIIDNVDSYENVLGYEILNEPQTTQLVDYVNMGVMNDFIAQRIRARSNKDVLYCRDNSIGGWQPKNVERPKMIPNVSGVVYDNHSYSLTRMKNLFVNETNIAKEQNPNIKVLVGEWAAQIQFDPTNILTLENEKFVLQLCKDNGYAIAWWALGHFGAGEWKRLANPDGTLRAEGNIYKQAISEVYQ